MNRTALLSETYVTWGVGRRIKTQVNEEMNETIQIVIIAKIIQ